MSSLFFLIVPFCGIILSLAFLPLFAPDLWHRHMGKISFAWAVISLAAMLFFWPQDLVLSKITHTVFEEYLSFFLFVSCLYVLSSGVFFEINVAPHPFANSCFLVLGALLSNLVGTTGAAIILIRPLIRMNQNRKHIQHIFLFFIFLVANIGGCLTPIGDPPLFLGFLSGVDFFWTLKFLWKPFLIASAILVCLFFVIDHNWYKKESIFQSKIDDKRNDFEQKKHNLFSMSGTVNIILLCVLVLFLIFNKTLFGAHSFFIFGHNVVVSDIALKGMFLILIALSFLMTPKIIFEKNHFSSFPIMEVGKIFFAIFITLIPILEFLKMGNQGPFATLLKHLNSSTGPNNFLYFWITGLLSGFLDNAPTYLLFFHTVGVDVHTLSSVYAKTLMAISCGAVFFGALTYIGNAPNMLVKSILLEKHILMPSFFGYMKWSILILLPTFLLVSILFFL